MDEKQILDEFKKISNQIRKYNPELDPFFDLKIKLKDYPKILYNFSTHKDHLRRQELIKKVIGKKIESLFGENYKMDLGINLDGPLALNIADHHQVLNHPFLLSSNIISSADKLLKDKKPEAIIVISSGDVPPSNYFSKNGFTFHNKRIPIFNTAEKEFCSYYIPKRDFNFIEKLKLADRWKEFNQEEKSFLITEYDKIKSYDYSKCKNYIDQITIINKNSWPYLFEEKLRANLPELIYLTQEEIVTDALIELLEDEENIVSKSIFDKKFRDCVLKNFRGNVVAWNEKEEKGTHFFWRKYPNRS